MAHTTDNSAHTHQLAPMVLQASDIVFPCHLPQATPLYYSCQQLFPTHTCTHTCTCMHARTHAHTHTRASTHAHTHVRAHAHAHHTQRTCAHMWCMSCACASTCTRTHTHTHAHTHTHTHSQMLHDTQNEKTKKKLECGPMPNVMATLLNIGGSLCSTLQSLADAHY